MGKRLRFRVVSRRVANLHAEQHYLALWCFQKHGTAPWDGETAIPQTFLSLALWFNITDNVGAFVDAYNYLHPDGNQYMTGFGFTWMPSRRVQLDVSCDLDFQNLGKYYSIGCGVAWMIK